jgi:hypothetical protein
MWAETAGRCASFPLSVPGSLASPAFFEIPQCAAVMRLRLAI